MRRWLGVLILCAAMAGAIRVTSPAADTYAVQAPSLVVPVTDLPKTARLGAMAYVTDCRAVTGVAAIILVIQPAGGGTGCLATFNGTTWNVGGTNLQVSK